MKNNILLNKFLLYKSEGLAYGITEMFSRNLAELLSDKIMIVYPDFDRDSFIQSVENHVVGKTYTRRISIFASLLKEHLPEDYERALSVLTGILGEENPNETGMFTHYYWIMPIGKFVQDYCTHCEFIEFSGKIALRYDSLCGKMAEGKNVCRSQK